MPLKEIDLIYRTAFAELNQKSIDGQFASDFPLEGRFVSVPVKSRDYWYFDMPTHAGDKRRYVGPQDDPEITRRVQEHKDIKDDLRARRRLVSMLLRSGGMSAPDAFAGDVTKALADAGLFRLRAVLIGAVAFGCYSGILGIRLPSAAIQTGDADYAQDFAISAAVQDSLPPFLDILHDVDPGFRAVAHQTDRIRTTAFVNRRGYRVEFLTGNRGSDDHTGKPSDMPALGGAAAENLRFLDYLIYEPVRTVLLHKEGVSVNVPAPERFAVHKLIVAARRQSDALGRAKREKDVLQAAILFEALLQTRQASYLAEAYEEAWNRGTAWRDAILSGFSLMPEAGKTALVRVIGAAPN